MKLVEDLFEHYRTKLTGDDEDIDILTLAVLEQLDHKEILEHILEMDEMELRSFFGLYIMETLKGKFAGSKAASPKDPSYFSSYRHLH
ncbi:DUF6154 family protein [Bacillus sp. 1P06AnD]|uniref:DUF6154 family protein n=1 Tax=Bacillus sp. 1P06AnD TaxID=3132208 RepID=UPI0039A1377B